CWYLRTSRSKARLSPCCTRSTNARSSSFSPMRAVSIVNAVIRRGCLGGTEPGAQTTGDRPSSVYCLPKTGSPSKRRTCRPLAGPDVPESVMGSATAGSSRFGQPHIKQPLALGQHLVETDGLQRTAEQITLQFVAMIAAQELQVLFGLHPFGHHRAIQAMGHFDGGPHDRLVVRIHADVANEALVDLDPVRRQAAQVIQRGGARAEIVDRDMTAQPVQRAEVLHQVRRR